MLAFLVGIVAAFMWARNRINPYVVIQAPAAGQHVFVKKDFAQLPAPRPQLALTASPTAALPTPTPHRLGIPQWSAVVNFMKNGDGSLIPIGVDRAQRPILIDRTRYPHVVFGGATGTGKTVAVRTKMAALLAAGAAVFAVNFKGSDLNGLDHQNLTVLPRFRNYDDAPRALSVLLNELVLETERRDDVLRRTGAKNWQQIHPSSKEAGEIAVFIDEFLSIIDFANDSVRDPLMDNQERDKSRSAVMSMWRNLKRITSEARKYGVYVIVTMTDPTKRNLGEDGERVLTQMTRVATGMNSGAACRVFLDIPAKSDFPQGTVGFEAGEFLINQGGILKHGRGFNPSAADFEALFNAVDTPLALLPAGLARLADTSHIERITRPEPTIIIPAPPSQAELDAAKLEPWAQEWAMTGKKTSCNRVALFLADREDLTKADKDQYSRAYRALECRAQNGCNWAKGLLGYVTADSRAQVMA